MKNNFRTHVIIRGDSLQRIALMYKLNSWHDLVYLNGLEYPYIYDVLDDDAYKNDPKVAKVGDRILIPHTGQSVPTDANLGQLEELAYGSDLDIFNYDQEWINQVNADIKGELIDESSDLRITSGVSNLKQQLLISIMVTKGSLMLHPKFGSNLKNMVGMKATVQNLNKMRIELVRTIRTNQNVKEVCNVSAQKVEGGVLLKADIIPYPPYSTFTFSYVLYGDE